MPHWRKLHVKAIESWDINDMPDDFTRLLWVMLPLALDREGRGQDSASWVKSKIMPLRDDVDNVRIWEALGWYANRGMIVRYQVNGRRYFYVPTWEKYQGNCDKEAESDYPTPPQVESRSGVGQELVESKSVSDSDADIDSDADASAEANLTSEFVPLGIDPTTGLKPANDGQQRHVDAASRGGQSRPVEPLDAVALHHYQGFMGRGEPLPTGKAERAKWTEAGKRILQRVGDRPLHDVLKGIDEWWVKAELDAFWKDKPCKDETLDLIARHCASNVGPPAPLPRADLSRFAIPPEIRAEEEARRAPH